MTTTEAPRRTATRPARRPTTGATTTRRTTSSGRAASSTGRGTTTPNRTRAASSARTATWSSPATSYYLVGGSTLLLLLLGLVMVLSASTVYSLRDSAGATPFSDFLNQAKFALVAAPVAYGISRLPPTWIRRLAWLGMIGALGLQMLVFTPLSLEATGGNSGWIRIGPQNLQPAEFSKLALAVWLGAVLAAKGPLLKKWSHVLMPAVLVAGMFLGIVVYTHDLGTALILIALVAGALWVAGVPMSMFSVAGAGVTAAVFFLVVSSDSRRNRILGFLSPETVDPMGLGLQPRHALGGLGTGGISGVGLGGSREKWLWLPEGHNDFIFAIIGEELGLLGTLLVLVLFAALAVGLTRIIKRHPDPFVKITTAAIGCWIIGQALVNIGVVIGVLPVVGLPLPLVSAGGSALVTTLAALGIVLAFARTEPGAKEALAARKASVRRSLAVIAPRLASGKARG
ncbi:peptidoglycan glycosyltransferase FtsW [Occultella gossypii]|uniref:Probable peptidoglycan glycosyltransferase FtsW n=1 Tax=Occultella gossypii TaxID=2800820 RepID=A0ABS7SGB2_9MICO|nr:putative peptidoglycan glycosyltransferase FtsW [Occultella gossypii]MBZ2199252.1 cell division protein FtsW [Occultella gossypii]